MNLIPEIYKGIDSATLSAWQKYQRENPGIWQAFKKYAFEIKEAGVNRYGAKSIMERVRWHIALKTKGEFKINNDFTALYARKLINNYPEFGSFFELRSIKGVRRCKLNN